MGFRGEPWESRDEEGNSAEEEEEEEEKEEEAAALGGFDRCFGVTKEKPGVNN